MSQRFSQRLDPWRLVSARETIEGRISLDSLSRLAPLLFPAKGEAAFVLAFDRDEARRAVIDCKVQAELPIVCQRCMKPMQLKLDLASRLALVKGFMEAEQLSSELDPLILDDDELIEVSALIEEELLLAIPQSPMHNPDECVLHASARDDMNDELDPGGEMPEQDNPFAVLAALSGSKPEN